MKLEIADIATNEKKKLSGFKVMGLFPFYLKYITTKTHIQLCKIKEQIAIVSPDEARISDFNDSKLQSKIVPLINTYCTVALANNRSFGWFFRFFIARKIEKCGHYHIFNLFMTIHKLDEPAFFFTYWKLIKSQDNTLLKVEKPS